MNPNPKIRFTKIRDVKSPERSGDNAGSDFFIPCYNHEYLLALQSLNEKNNLTYEAFIEHDRDTNDLFENLAITIPAGSQIMIPSGIKVDIYDKNTYLDANNKGGIATKYNLVTGAKVVDAGFQGEIFINLHNVGNEPATIFCGMKIVQFIHREYIKTDWEEISNDEYKYIPRSSRGDGCLSSTGLK